MQAPEKTQIEKYHNWILTFFQEKDLPVQSWEIVDVNGNTHFIDSNVVINTILTNPNEQETKEIIKTLRRIDFYNGDVMHFIKFLAEGLVKNYGGAL